MDGAVGVGRAVVEDVAGRAGAGAGGSGRRGPAVSHAARRRGSLTGRLAFMGKSVCGRFRVAFEPLLLVRLIERFSVDLSGLGSGCGRGVLRTFIPLCVERDSW